MCIGETRPYYRPRDAQRQIRFNRRFHGLRPEDFSQKGVAICAISNLDAPPSFESCWFKIDTTQGVTRELLRLAEFDAVLIVCDLMEDREVRQCTSFLHLLESLERQIETELPLVLLLQHLAEMPRSIDGDGHEDYILDTACNLFREGLDEAIVGDLSGFSLVCALQAKLGVFKNRSEQAQSVLSKHRADLERVYNIEEATEFTLWDYVRVRMKMDVPEVDEKIPPGKPQKLGGYKVGQLLGAGGLAKVYKMEKRNHESQALKVISKKNIRGINDLVTVNNQIRCLKRLSVGKDPHPNIARLYNVYHTPTHICLRMQDGGDLDLYHWMVDMEKEKEVETGLTLTRVRAILSQAMMVISYLHCQAAIVHRDIKCENICIRETVEDPVMRIKLIDFDTSIILNNPEQKTSSVTGTFPFMAPEMFSGTPYVMVHADIWSLGVLCLELLCAARLLEDILDMKTHVFEKQVNNSRRELMEKIKDLFVPRGSLETLLEAHIRPHLRTFTNTSIELCKGLVEVDVDKRNTAWQLPDLVETHLKDA